MGTPRKTLRVGIVAGEASGDILGAGLIRALRQHCGELQVEGIGGPLMQAEGCHSFFPQDRLAVMGLVEPLLRLPELLRIRRFLRQHFLANPPDVFIGIDSPDFNLGLEIALRRGGIRTVHYVSPSVWAWRQGRLKTIARAADLVLTLFPFEERFYRQHAAGYPSLRAICVGHPLADALPMEPDQAGARERLGLPAGKRLVALLPGSRSGEVARMGPLFLAVASWCLACRPDLAFVMPAANAARELQLQPLLADHAGLPLTLVSGQSQDCMAASDIVLMASGTTTLEAMLLKKPMVVAYRLAPLSFALISRLLRVPYVSLPNLLANERLVPEFLQDAATVESIGSALLGLLDNAGEQVRLQARFAALHEELRRDASQAAADAVLGLLERPA